MGFLDKLWDETVAGPAPDAALNGPRRRSDDRIAASRRQLRPAPALRRLSVDPGSDPSSPTCSTPTTPLTPGTPNDGVRSFARKSVLDESPRNPTICDWVLIGALDS